MHDVIDDSMTAGAWFESHGLAAPWLPAPLGDALRRVGPYVFSTIEPLPATPIWLPGWLDALDEGALPSFAMVGYDGRGSSTHAMHLYAAIGPLAVFVQVPWGTAFGNAAAQAANVAQVFASVAPLLRAAAARADEARRWVLVLSGFERSGWRKLPSGRWHRKEPLRKMREKLGIDGEAAPG